MKKIILAGCFSFALLDGGMMADTKEEVQIVGQKEELSDEQKRFIDFCRPLRDYAERGKYLFCKGSYKYFDKNNPDILKVEGETFKSLSYKEMLNPNSTGRLTISFLESDNGFYFYRVAGGCVAYEDDLFGPFILKEGEFVKVTSFSNILQKKDEGLTKSQIIQVALDKAKELGYKLEQMTATYDEDNKSIKEHLNRTGIFTYNEKLKNGKRISQLPRSKNILN